MLTLTDSDRILFGRRRRGGEYLLYTGHGWLLFGPIVGFLVVRLAVCETVLLALLILQCGNVCVVLKKAAEMIAAVAAEA